MTTPESTNAQAATPPELALCIGRMVICREQVKERNEKMIGTQRFPQKRNGVSHPKYGSGVVILAEHSVGSGSVLVQFDSETDRVLVPIEELTSLPSRGESPDPKTHRNSGWVGGNNYRQRGKG